MEFQHEKESWDSYTERLEHFFMATRMEDDDKKVFTLIHQNGPSFYTLLKELSFPNNPTQMAYADIKDILKRHYVGSKNIFCERKLFYCAQMKPNENASEWHRRIRSLAINCDFGKFLEEILVDKFVTGFQGKVLQRLYEMDEHLSVQKALEIAQRYENDLTSVEQTKTDKKAQKKQPEQQKQNEAQQQDRRNVPTCLKCGKKGHNANVCRSQLQGVQVQDSNVQLRQEEQHQTAHGNVPTCFKCGKKGHYANVCHSQFQGVPINNSNVQPRPEVQNQKAQGNVPTCFKCGKKGHYANVCRSNLQGNDFVYVYPEQPQQQQQVRRDVPTCHNCGKRGHYANVCHRKEEEGCSIS